MNKRDEKRPPLRQLVLGTLLGLFFAGLLYILPGLRNGGNFGHALRRQLAADSGWLGGLIAIAVVAAMIWVVYPFFFRWIKRPGEVTGSGSVWRRYRWVMTVSTLVSVTSLLLQGIQTVRAEHSLPLDQVLFLAIIGLFFITLIVYVWITRPSDEKVIAIETGQTERLHDERHREIVGRSAASTLYITLAVVLVGGSIFDVLVTRLWPFRSAFEVVLIFVLWNVMYQRWNKRL